MSRRAVRSGQDSAVPADALEAAIAALRAARGVVVLTGAGVSAESGLRTFRDDDGDWSDRDAMWLATAEGFERDPAAVSAWYDERRRAVLTAEPNAGHRALAELERAVVAAGGRFLLLTQNVDGLHQRAGSERVVELHGTIVRWRDHRSGTIVTPSGEPLARHPMPGPDGGWLRPDVVWFGEMLPDAAIEAAYEAIGWCDLFLVVGTSAVVHPAAGFVGLAAEAGARTIEVNPRAAADDVWLRLQGASGEVLPRLVAGALGTA